MNYVTVQLVNMKFAISLLLLAFASQSFGEVVNDADTYLSRFIADLWLEGTDVLRTLWRDCSKKIIDTKNIIDHKEYFPKFVKCMKRRTLRALDRCLSPDVVPLTDGVNLVRFELVDHSGNAIQENYTSSWTDKELEEEEWRHLALQRMANVLRTHVLKFDFDDNKAPEKVEYRGRRRHQMMTMMMFGIVSIGMILVPMGFQFLAVLGGKALLLAKMALILASIQGLKKIATNPLNYGFYQSYPQALPFDHFEKRSRDDQPSSAMMPPSVPENYLNIDRNNVKFDRMQVLETANDEINVKRDTTNKHKDKLTENTKEKSRYFPIYADTANSVSPSVVNDVDLQTPLVDLTTRPGEVQADYSLDLPYNGFHFQSTAPIVSA